MAKQFLTEGYLPASDAQSLLANNEAFLKVSVFTNDDTGTVSYEIYAIGDSGIPQSRSIASDATTLKSDFDSLASLSTAQQATKLCPTPCPPGTGVPGI